MPRHTLLLLVAPLLLVLLAAPPASAADGVIEINQTCAFQTGCFSGDAAGLPVTITAPGSYRLTSNLSFNGLFGPPSTNFVEVNAGDVDFDLNGFAIRCANALTGAPCTGSTISGVSIAAFAKRVRVHDGSFFGMPGDGVFGVNSGEIVLERLRASESGRNGLQAGGGSRVERCTVEGSAQLGLVVGFDSIVIGNVVRDSGDVGLSVGSGSVVRGNTSNDNASTGIRAVGDSVVEGNTAGRNQIGFSLADTQAGGGLARDNVANGNTGLGMSLGPSWVFTDNVVQGNNSGANQTSGGIQGTGNYCGTTLGCP